jgi:hypothetical protein
MAFALNKATRTGQASAQTRHDELDPIVARTFRTIID